MISVIVPTFNGEETIADCLNSLLNQRCSCEYEIMVVNDGSSDRTSDIVKKYPVKLLAQEHRGPAATRNLGAINTSGNILLFTDDDCVAEKNWIEEMVKPLENKEIVGVQGRYKTDQRSLIARFAQYEIEERYERMQKHKYIDFIGSYSAAYRRDVFLKEGGFDESFPIASGEDPDLSFRLAAKGHKMVFTPGAVVYHHHPDTLLKYLRQKFYRAYWRVALYRKNPKKAVRDSYTPQTLKIQLGFFYLFVFSLIYAIATRYWGIIIAAFFLFFLPSLPLSLAILRKDKAVGAAAPFLIMLRSAALGIGMVSGMLRSYRSLS